MKRIIEVWLLLLVLGAADAQQFADVSSNTTSDTVEQIKSKASNSDPIAELILGHFYFRATNYVEAVKWYQKSAEQGLLDAQSQAGICFLNGFGVAKNEEQAAKWFIRAAKQGDKIGQMMLGMCYANGMGVPVNDIEAYKWLSIASAREWRESNVQADESQKDFAEFLKSAVETIFKTCQEKMSRAEIIEAQRLAAAFVPQKESPGSSSDKSASSSYPTATGTGFFITDDGYLITNYHVVKDAAKVRLVTDAGLVDAMVVKVDSANDIALFKIETEFPSLPDPLGIEKQKPLKPNGKFAPLPIAASRTVKLGGTVATVGFPDIGLQGFAPKLAKGEIASLAGAADDPRYFQISVPVQPGNSGGALVDAHGNVVGIVAAKLDASVALAASGALPENVNYAVKSSLLLSFLESVPDVSAKLKEPNTKDESFEDVVKSAQDAAVLVLVY